MMFNEGRQPQLIKYSDYVRWKKSVVNKLQFRNLIILKLFQNTVFGIIEEEDFNEANSKFREHEAQWRLNKRGVEGETMVHLLLNREEPLCTEIARILIHCYPGLAKDVYLGDEMFGKYYRFFLLYFFTIYSKIFCFRTKLFAFGYSS